MNKQAARAHYRALRAALSPSEREKLADLLLIQFQSVAFPPLERVLSFYPLMDRGEPDTFILTRYLQFSHPGLVVAYPRTGADGSMEAVATDEDTEFGPGGLGIPEPLTGEVLLPEYIDLVLVPMLGCDEQGNRIGYGKGFYDRYLARTSALRAGLSLFEPLPRIGDASEYDIPLHLCITPQRTYVF